MKKPYSLKDFLDDIAKANVRTGTSTPVSRICRDLNLVTTDLSIGSKRVFEIAKQHKGGKGMLRFHHFLPALFQCVYEKIEPIDFPIEECTWLQKPELWTVRLTKDTSKGYVNCSQISTQLRKFLKLADDAAIVGNTWPGCTDTYLIGGRCELKLLHLLKAIAWWQPRSSISPPWRDVDVRPINEYYRKSIFDSHDILRVAHLDIMHDNAIQFRDYLYHGSWIKLAEICATLQINPLLCREKLLQGVLLDGKREPAKNIPKINGKHRPEEIAAFCKVFGLDDEEYLRFISP